MGETKLTPLQIGALEQCEALGGAVRCNDGGVLDTMLSGLCSTDPPMVTWQMNPASRIDGYISLYTITEAGREALRKTS